MQVPRNVSNDDRRDVQLLVRVTQSQKDVLDSISHLEQVTANGYAHSILAAHLSHVAQLEHVRRDLENRRSFEEGHLTVSRLPAPATGQDELDPSLHEDGS